MVDKSSAEDKTKIGRCCGHTVCQGVHIAVLFENKKKKRKKRNTLPAGLEPAASSLEGWRSSIELRELFIFLFYVIIFNL